MTFEERHRLREAIDKARRDRLAKHEARLKAGKAMSTRAPYWRDYYAGNRDKILAQRAARRQAA